jgi:hypothetical protein
MSGFDRVRNTEIGKKEVGGPPISSSSGSRCNCLSGARQNTHSPTHLQTAMCHADYATSATVLVCSVGFCSRCKQIQNDHASVGGAAAVCSRHCCCCWRARPRQIIGPRLQGLVSNTTVPLESFICFCPTSSETVANPMLVCLKSIRMRSTPGSVITILAEPVSVPSGVPQPGMHAHLKHN